MADLEPLAETQRAYLASVASTTHLRTHRDRAIAAAVGFGASYGQVARVVGLPRGTVQSIVRRFRGTTASTGEGPRSVGPAPP